MAMQSVLINSDKQEEIQSVYLQLKQDIFNAKEDSPLFIYKYALIAMNRIELKLSNTISENEEYQIFFEMLNKFIPKQMEINSEDVGNYA